VTPRTARSGPCPALLQARDLAGTKLVFSDVHAGLEAAIAAVMIGAKLAALWLKFLRDEDRIEATAINEYELVMRQC
jgi:transposase-like protein